MVSRICMGCMGFGDPNKGGHTWTIDEENAASIVASGLEYGINFFDTAPVYQGGTSEEYLGDALRKAGVKREEVIVATKFPPRSQKEIDEKISGQQHVENALGASLERLGMDYVDLYIMHMWDYGTPIEELMEGLSLAVKARKARYIGISNCYAWQLQKANEVARAHGWPEFVSVQNHFNLLFREEEREMAPLCEQDDIAQTPYSPLASGRLARKPGESSKRLEEDTYAKGKYDATADQDAVIIERVNELADKLGVTMTQISLAWLLTKVTAPVVGMTKLEQVSGAAGATDVHLTPDQVKYLEEPYVPHKLVGVMAQNKPKGK